MTRLFLSLVLIGAVALLRAYGPGWARRQGGRVALLVPGADGPVVLVLRGLTPGEEGAMDHTDCPLCRGRYARRCDDPSCPCDLVEETGGTHQGQTCGWPWHRLIDDDPAPHARPSG